MPVRDGVQTLAVLRDLEIQELPFPADTAVRLAQLRATAGPKMPDCCVLLAAEGAAVFPLIPPELSVNPASAEINVVLPDPFGPAIRRQRGCLRALGFIDQREGVCHALV